MMFMDADGNWFIFNMRSGVEYLIHAAFGINVAMVIFDRKPLL